MTKEIIPIPTRPWVRRQNPRPKPDSAVAAAIELRYADFPVRCAVANFKFPTFLKFVILTLSVAKGKDLHLPFVISESAVTRPG